VTLATRTQRGRTPASVIAARLERQAALSRSGAYPLTQYQADPVRYARERLHVSLMPHQEAILRALAAGIRGDVQADGRKAAPRVSVRSGQKCGKTLIAIVAAFFFYECFPASRVFLCAAIEAQTKLVLWRELAGVLRHARASGVDIDGKAAASPAGGFISSDGSREIRGLSGRDIESLAGLSGSQLMIVDEASALPESKAAVYEGNQLGGGNAGMLWISNPTRTSGPFYDSHHSASEYWQTFHIDGQDVADWQESTGRRIPYTVTREKIEEARERWGEASPFFILRVRGEFLRNEVGVCVSMGQIEEAGERWATMPDEGLLVIGYDVAGAGIGGDLHAFAVVRGKKCLAIHTRPGLTIDAGMEEILSLLRVNRRSGETPRLHIDAEGPIGSVMFARLHDEAERRAKHDRNNMFEVVAIRSSSRTVRQVSKFERQRDEMIWNLGLWMADGGIPKDDKLEAELHAPRWSAINEGRIKATAKDDLRDILNRSPDRFDALCLAVQPPPAWLSADLPEPDAAPPQRGNVFADHEDLVGENAPLDPFSGGPMNPYGGRGY
jgi:phage terminase large subunit